MQRLLLVVCVRHWLCIASAKADQSLCLLASPYVSEGCKSQPAPTPEPQLRRLVVRRRHVSLEIAFEPQLRAVPQAGVTLQLRPLHIKHPYPL